MLTAGAFRNYDPIGIVNYAYDNQDRLISRSRDPDGALGPQTAYAKEYYVYDRSQIIAQLDFIGIARRHELWAPGVDQLLANDGPDHKTNWALLDQEGTIRDVALPPAASFRLSGRLPTRCGDWSS
jgi:hypothetical protein